MGAQHYLRSTPVGAVLQRPALEALHGGGGGGAHMRSMGDVCVVLERLDHHGRR